MPDQRYKLETRFSQSDWKCHLFGGDERGIVWTPVKGDEPNWFWRTMQHLILGHRWVKN